MKNHLHRRSFLSGVMTFFAALGSSTFSSAVEASPRKIRNAGSFGSDCAHKHDQIAKQLSNMARSPEIEASSVNRALKTAHCPSCNTRIGFDPSTA